jgi:hypothetical protein
MSYRDVRHQPYGDMEKHCDPLISPRLCASAVKQLPFRLYAAQLVNRTR